MPPYTRALTTSASASAKPSNDRLGFCMFLASVSTQKVMSGPNAFDNTYAAAPLSVECPERYSGWGGVPASHGVHVASPAVAALLSVSPSRIAVIGRQKTNRYFASQHA